MKGRISRTINLLSPKYLNEFKAKKIIAATAIMLLLFGCFNVYLAFNVHSVNQKFMARQDSINEINTLKASLRTKQQLLDERSAQLEEIKKKGFPFRAIVEYLGTYAPQGVIVLSAFSQGENVIVRGISRTADGIATMVAGLKEALGTKVEITQVAPFKDSQAFELTLNTGKTTSP